MLSKEEYKEFIEFKLKSAKYHHDACLQVIYKSFPEEDTDAQTIAVSSEFTAMMLTFQSALDLLAQYINDKRDLKLDKKRLYFSSIVGKSIPEKKLVSILSKETKYLTAYCNTVKHRNLIHISDSWAFITQFQSVRVFIVDSFERNSYVFPEENLNSLIYTTYMTLTAQLEEMIGLE